MRIPETPSELDKLDLMRQLKQYADGAASWRDGEDKPDDRERGIATRCTLTFEDCSST